MMKLKLSWILAESYAELPLEVNLNYDMDQEMWSTDPGQSSPFDF